MKEARAEGELSIGSFEGELAVSQPDVNMSHLEPMEPWNIKVLATNLAIKTLEGK